MFTVQHGMVSRITKTESVKGLKFCGFYKKKKKQKKKNGQIDMYDFPVTDCTQELLSFSGNHEHLKNFRTVDCVLANYNKVQDTQANLKTTN